MPANYSNEATVGHDVVDSVIILCYNRGLTFFVSFFSGYTLTVLFN